MQALQTACHAREGWAGPDVPCRAVPCAAHLIAVRLSVAYVISSGLVPHSPSTLQQQQQQQQQHKMTWAPGVVGIW